MKINFRHIIGIVISLFVTMQSTNAEMVPRYSVNDLPKPLSALDVHLYSTAIKLQDNQHWQGASFVREAIDNKVVVPWLDYNAYNHTFKPQGDFDDLNKFIKTYPNHPYANKIYNRAKNIRADDDEKLAKLVVNEMSLKKPQEFDVPAVTPEERTAAQKRQANNIIRQVKSSLDRNDYQTAERLILSDEAMGVLSFYEADTITTTQPLSISTSTNYHLALPSQKI